LTYWCHVELSGIMGNRKALLAFPQFLAQLGYDSLWRGGKPLHTDGTNHSTLNKLRTRTTNSIELLRSTCRNDSRAIVYPSCPTWLMIPCGAGSHSTMMGRTSTLDKLRTKPTSSSSSNQTASTIPGPLPPVQSLSPL
jgi:hypothetical protein